MNPKAVESSKWVEERSRCSPFEVFKRLQAEVTLDVETRLQIAMTETPSMQLKVDSYGPGPDRFRVLRYPEHMCVEFALKGDNVIVIDGAGKELLVGDITLNDDGECVFRCQGKDLLSWQFRKRVLETLFFKGLAT